MRSCQEERVLTLQNSFAIYSSLQEGHNDAYQRLKKNHLSILNRKSGSLFFELLKSVWSRTKALNASLLAYIFQWHCCTPLFCNNNRHEDEKSRPKEVRHTLDFLKISRLFQNHSSWIFSQVFNYCCSLSNYKESTNQYGSLWAHLHFLAC